MNSSKYKSFLEMSTDEITELIKLTVAQKESQRQAIVLDDAGPIAGYEIGDRVYDIFTSKYGTVSGIREVEFESVYAYVLWDGDEEPRIQPRVPNVKKVGQ